jgi:hypothetical protein
MAVGQDISLKPFKQALGSTTLLSAGGYGPDNFAKAIESGTSDLVAFGRYFMWVTPSVFWILADHQLQSWFGTTAEEWRTLVSLGPQQVLRTISG